MLRLTQQLPSLDYLMVGIEKINEQYQTDDSSQLKLIRILNFLLQDNTLSLPYKEAQYIVVGAYLFCLLSINNPNDPLYRLIANRLVNDIDEMTGLICLQRFYTFLNENTIKEDCEDIKLAVHQVISDYLTFIHPIIVSLSQIIPSKEHLLYEIKNLVSNYQQAKEKQELARQASWACLYQSAITTNPEREKIAQLGSALCHILQTHYLDDKETVDEMSFSKRVLIGYLWFIIQSIHNHCFTDTTNLSQLYRLACEALHVLGIKDPHSFMTKTRQEICLTAFESFIEDRKNVKLIEDYARKHFKEKPLLIYIHPPLRKLKEELGKMNDALAAETQVTSAGILLSEFGAWFTRPIGYGMGYFPGFLLSRTPAALSVTMTLANVIQSAAVFFNIGTSGGVAAVIAAAYVGEAVTLRASEVMCQYIVSRIAYYTGMATGTVVFDMPFKAVCHLYEQLKKKDLALETNLTEEFVQSLKAFPVNLFSNQEDRKRVAIYPDKLMAAKLIQREKSDLSREESDGDLSRHSSFFNSDSDSDFSIEDECTSENDEEGYLIVGRPI